MSIIIAIFEKPPVVCKNNNQFLKGLIAVSLPVTN